MAPDSPLELFLERVALALLVACLGCAPTGDPETEHATTSAAAGRAGQAIAHSAVLLTLDTTRADALSCFSGKTGRTPHLDGIAADGVLYERARTVAPLTLPSHTSMLTGLYPPRHTVRDNGLDKVPDAALTLAELAAEADIDTAAFLAAVVLDGAYGLGQGFDVYDSPAAELRQSSHYVDRPASEVVDHGLAWLADRDPERRFFLWLHFFDPHAPYHPSYRGAVAEMDAQIGRLLEALRASGAYERTAIMVVGDHGEGLNEHGEATHGLLCYESTMRVPMILRTPGGPRGARSQEITSVVDVLPTLATLLGLPVPADLDGVDLTRGVAPDRGVYFESYHGWINFGWSPLAGWVDANGKYLHSSQPEFYDPVQDPAESMNLAEQHAARLPAYRAALQRVAQRPGLTASADGVDPAMLAQLEALGYAAGERAGRELPAPDAPSDLPSPSSSVAELDQFLTARGLVDMGQLEPAAAIFERLIDKNPENWNALGRYGHTLMRLGRMDEAIAPLTTLMTNGPQRVQESYNLAVCLESVGRVAEALPWFELALDLQPERVHLLMGSAAEAHAALGGHHLVHGDPNRAAEHFTEALRHAPDSGHYAFQRGIALEATGDTAAALRSYADALELFGDPGADADGDDRARAEAHHNKAGLHLRLGQHDEALRHYTLAVRLRPDFAESHLGLGFAQYALGQVDAALDSFVAAATHDPDNAGAHFNAATLLQQRGDAPRARTHLERVLELEPGNESAAAALRALPED